MRARITKGYFTHTTQLCISVEGYIVEWLNDDGSVYQSHAALLTLSSALAWCREQDIGYWQPVGFSDQFIKVPEE